MSTGRINRTKGIALAAITSTAVVAGVLFIQSGADADPKPTLDEAKKQVAALQHKSEEAGEAANDLRGQISSSQARLKALQTAVNKQQAQADVVKRQIGSLAVAGYQTSGMSTTAQLLLSSNPDQFLSQASTAQAFAGQQNAVLRKFQDAQGKVADLQASAKSELAQLQAVQAQQNKLIAEAKSNLDAAEKVLGKLSDAERERIRKENEEAAEKARNERPSRDGDRMDDLPIPANGRAGVAVKAAMNQLGDPYVWGEEGPSSFDCSGLMLYAWGKAGVSLPHSSKAQANEGRRVSKSQLMPGDLIFFYSPVSHVGMYIGGGRMVHAPRPGKSVETSSINTMPYNSAIRPG
ncbi:NlpC/P60 family protein [Kribbella sp. NPDC056951]|uniref:C40 family peptidase n=1 Tax=Kribbella sp. NPDC056951 TaxID=3345978 RepID=UPI00363EED6F